MVASAWRMATPGSRLRRGFTLVATASLTLASCDSETIDLLPPDTSQTAGVSGSDGNPVGSHGGADADSQPMGGETNSNTSAGGTGGGGGCGGQGCAGFNFGGFGGSLWTGYCDPSEEECWRCEGDQECPERTHCLQVLGLCVECADSRHCLSDFACDLDVGRCRPACDNENECDNGNRCNLEHGTCVQCLDHRDCDFDGDEDTRYCDFLERKCVECFDDRDCTTREPRTTCAVGRCVETECINDDQCRQDQYCDIARGRCEP